LFHKVFLYATTCFFTPCLDCHEAELGGFSLSYHWILSAGFYINRVGSTLLDQATVERLSIQNQQIVDMVESVAQVQNQTADQMAELLRIVMTMILD